MRKIIALTIAAITTSHVFADNITDGISISGDGIYSYTTYVQPLGFAIAAVIGLVGAYSVYLAYIQNSPDIRKKMLTWGCSCLGMLCMTLALPSFFDYQESGASIGSSSTGNVSGNGSSTGNVSGNGSSTGNVSGNGSYAGGDRYGVIDSSIPDPSDSRWIPDDRYTTIMIGGTVSNLSEFLNSTYRHYGAGTAGSYDRTMSYLSELYNEGNISGSDYGLLVSYAERLPHY